MDHFRPIGFILLHPNAHGFVSESALVVAIPVVSFFLNLFGCAFLTCRYTPTLRGFVSLRFFVSDVFFVVSFLYQLIFLAIYTGNAFEVGTALEQALPEFFIV